MAVHIRLRRMGKKKSPFYRIVAADSRRARDGRFLEILGTYNPVAKPARVKLFEERVGHWLDEGAVPSDTVRALFTQVGYIEKYLKLKKGEDISGIELKTEITERPKKTKKMKKAVAKKTEAASEKTEVEAAPEKTATKAAPEKTEAEAAPEKAEAEVEAKPEEKPEEKAADAEAPAKEEAESKKDKTEAKDEKQE